MNELTAMAPGFESNLDYLTISTQLGLGFILSILIQYHFKIFAKTVSNRQELRVVIPFICLTTILVIAVVKSSLALSLGLVGALSIVRFRTPIKEPEELAYLFLAIATGLGLGASQIEGTIVAILSILLLMAVVKKMLKSTNEKSVFLNISIMDEQTVPDNDKINTIILSSFDNAELIRYGVVSNDYQMVYRLFTPNVQEIPKVTTTLKQDYEKISINFVEAPANPGL